MLNSREDNLVRTLVLLDIVLILVSFFSAIELRDLVTDEGAGSLERGTHLRWLPFIISALFFFLYAFGAYRTTVWKDAFWDDLFISLKAVGAFLMLIFGVNFLFQIGYLSRAVILIFAVTSVVLLVSFRALIRALRKDTLESRLTAVLVIGCGQRGQRFVRAVAENPDWKIRVIGYLDRDVTTVGEELQGVKVLGQVNEISRFLEQNIVDEVIVAIPRSIIIDLEGIALACEEQGVKFRYMADMIDKQVARMGLAMLGTIPLLTFEPVAQDEFKLFVKRLLDVAAVCAAMPVLMPLLGVISVLIRLDSPGSIFFVQERIGYRKRVFKMYKFRSMCENSEALQSELETVNEADGPIFKIENDPRITKVGRFLRKSSLDELPQLINVLKGDMSLVGPRPMSIRDVSRFDKSIQRKRFSVRPGLTCLWQVSGRSNLSFDDWLKLDLEYIDNWSLRLDLKILAKTVPAVIQGKGAV